MRLVIFIFFVFTTVEAGACEPVPDASKIAVAGGSVTEILYFLGQEHRIIAVDSTSNFPEQAKSFPSVGYVRSLSAEGILSLQPSLVLGESDMGPDAIVKQIRNTNVSVVTVPKAVTADGIVEKIRCVANVIGEPKLAEKLIRDNLTTQLERLQKKQSSDASYIPRVALLLMFSESSPIVAGNNTSGQGVLNMVGAENVFQNIEGWKPVSMEAIIQANPDFVVITNRGVNSAGGLQAIYDHPGIRLTHAGRYQKIIALDGMSLLGFGPRTLSTAVGLLENLTPEFTALND